MDGVGAEPEADPVLRLEPSAMTRSDRVRVVGVVATCHPRDVGLGVAWSVIGRTVPVSPTQRVAIRRVDDRERDPRVTQEVASASVARRGC